MALPRAIERSPDTSRPPEAPCRHQDPTPGTPHADRCCEQRLQRRSTAFRQHLVEDRMTGGAPAVCNILKLAKLGDALPHADPATL
ncbi:MAG: hypothetical protein AVDCRST_MAG53-1961 [uncultured Solirubrobacteraceae bacterium]|uniref:Uncharacterized protein n=1 Tax=uncultured Solirubrobacteraceae bacterium TaxID=1162706 RepID=A0A6J4SKF9_9ACTN|nr:MAG: hypothetical protein AVDCRST_MAG53-1961 [uncultured Solirubrobacteraceae bacterium]